jgi:hypothetical protein
MLIGMLHGAGSRSNLRRSEATVSHCVENQVRVARSAPWMMNCPSPEVEVWRSAGNEGADFFGAMPRGGVDLAGNCGAGFSSSAFGRDGNGGRVSVGGVSFKGTCAEATDAVQQNSE